MKRLFIILGLFFASTLAKASDEVIMLDASEINQLKVPASPVFDYVHSNKNKEYSKYNKDDEEISFSDEEDIDNKLIKTFYKFVDDKVINNKVNKFTSSMIENIDESE